MVAAAVIFTLVFRMRNDRYNTAKTISNESKSVKKLAKHRLEAF